MTPLARSMLLSLLALGSCGTAGIKVFGGYTQVQLSGSVALDSSVGGVPLGTRQADVENDLGLGDQVGSPYVRGEVDLGLVALTASGFAYEETGNGTLTVDFGDIAAGENVTTDLEFLNGKAAVSLDLLDLGFLRLSPGVALDVFSIDMRVESGSGFEEVDTLAPVPMLFGQAGVALGGLGATVDIGWMSADMGDVDGTWWDIEALARVSLIPSLELFGGYRYISIDGEGDADGQRFASDLEFEGWMAGVGLVW